MAEEIIFKTEINDGEYSCGDIGISTSEWYELLQDNNAQQYIGALLCFLREPKHTSSCSEVSSKNGDSSQHYNSKITNFGKFIQKKLNRFSIIGTDGNTSFWGIPMQKGWYSKKGFQWQMRDELVKALQNYLMHNLIQVFKAREPFNGYKEEYKWALLDEVEGNNIERIIKCLRGKNVVYNEQVDGILKKLWESKPEELSTCINNLLDETRSLTPRIEGFRDEMRKICPSEWKSCANDERTASAILTCKYPYDYTFYKNEVYQTICRYFGFECRDPYLKFEHFLELINGFARDFGEEIQQIMMPQIVKYKNKPLNLAVQTLFWCMKEEMKTTKQSELITIQKSTSQETMPKKKYQEYIELLLETHNLVLTGAPGTGKTFMAQAIADEMGAVTMFVQFHPSYDYSDFVEGLRPIKKDDGQIGFERKDGIFKRFCKDVIIKDKTIEFNNVIDYNKISDYLSIIENIAKKEYPNYYNDMILPVLSNKNCWFDLFQNKARLRWGLSKSEYIIVDDSLLHYLLNTSNEEWNNKEILDTLLLVLKIISRQEEISQHENSQNTEKFVFIIDEINRGEISKIFGELFFSIDPGYRGEKGRVCTQYQNMIESDDVFKNGFFVPENVYIIGTMNDIDRSVESMDFAMRRRFTWKEVTPSDTADMLDTLDCAAEAKATMTRLNDVIAETDGLGSAYMIGPAYFLKLGENGCDFNKLWKMNIEPLLKEYLRGFRKSDEILKKFSKAYFDNKEESTKKQDLIDED